MATLFPGVALVTGAASGTDGICIGQAVAISFAREGCKRIAIAELNEGGLKRTTDLMYEAAPSGDELQTRSTTTNILNADEVGELVEVTVDFFGRVDYAVNCAGIIGSGDPSHSMSVEDFDRTNNVNYRGCWLSSRAEIRQMRMQEALGTHDGRPGGRGAIVNIASQLGIVGRPDSPAYCASKAAVISMTRCDAIDCSKDNIRVNCVCPGYIQTPMTQANIDASSSKHYIDIAPMKRAGTAQEVADCVLFLCSSKASFVQGSAMVVDGGYVIN